MAATTIEIESAVAHKILDYQSSLTQDTLDAIRSGSRAPIIDARGTTLIMWRFECDDAESRDLCDWLGVHANGLRDADEQTAGEFLKARSIVCAAARHRH